MAYYPASQIKTNLYTNGGEFVIASTKEDYMGNYWTLSNNKYFSGKTPQDSPVFEIIPLSKLNRSIPPEIINKTSVVAIFNNDPIPPYSLLENSLYNQGLVQTYSNIKKDSQIVKIVPTYFPNVPTQQNYTYGKYIRYFCKKTNEVIYLEISKETYDKLVGQDPQILWQLYIPFNLPWQLTGDKEQVYKTNRNITELTSVRQKLPMLAEYLKNDFTKYYK